jgi:PAS domain S-box-containing protein
MIQRFLPYLPKPWVLILSGGFVLLLAGIAATSPCLAADDPPEILVGSEQDFRPYSFVDENGLPAGFGVDLIKAVARTMGLSIRIKPGTWNEVWNGLVAGDIDALPVVAKLPNRIPLVEFSLPHTETFDAFFVRQGEPLINDIRDAEGKEIVVMRSDAAHHALQERKFQGKIIPVDTIPEGLALISSGKHDALLCSKLIGTLEIKDRGIRGVTAGPVIPDYKRVFSFAVKKDNHELLEKLNQGLLIVKTNGEYDRIYEKWLAIDEPWKNFEKYLIPAIGVVLGGALLAGIWIIVLQTMVNKRTRELAQRNEMLRLAGEKLEERVALRTAELARSVNRFRSLYEQAVDGIFVSDAQGNYIDVNAAGARLLGYERQEILHLNIADVVAEAERQRLPPEFTKLAGGAVVRSEWQFRRKDGSLFPGEVVGKQLSDGRLQTILRDITAHKQAEEALHRLNESLEQRVKERTADLSRTIETLQEEVANRTLAEKSLRERTEQLGSLASELTLAEQRERQRLAQVLHDGLQQLLAAANFRLSILERIEDDQVRRHVTELNGLICASIEMSRSLTAELSPPILREGGLQQALVWLGRWMRDKHDLAVDLHTQISETSMGEDVAILLFQATRELLFNVVKHAGVKSAQLQATSLPDGYLQITVTDQGAGFNADMLCRDGGRCGGFGLFSIRERLDLLGGSLEIDSKPGRGSRFTLTIPLWPLAEETSMHGHGAQKSAEVVPQWGPVDKDKIRIVLVDDHSIVRQGLAVLLQDETDMQVVGEAADGEAAVALVCDIQPDIVLMDISMPKMNGIEATRIIRAELPDVQVIGLSMYEETELALTMLQAGAINYLMKTGLSTALLTAIREAASRKTSSVRLGTQNQ